MRVAPNGLRRGLVYSLQVPPEPELEVRMSAETILQFANRVSFRQAVWLFPMVFALHVMEEAPRFTTWVNRYASKQFTQANFIQNNALGMALGIVFCILVWLSPSRAIVFLFFATCVTQAFFNIFFHVGTTVAFHAYSPGVITSLILYPPLVFYLTRLAYQEGLLTGRMGILVFCLGGAVHAAVVAKQVFFVRLF